MKEYIDRNLIEWYGCNFEEPSCKNRECSGCSHAECSHSQVMQIPPADVVERAEYEKLKKESTELKIKYDDAEKRFCNAMDRNAKLRSKIDKAIEKIVFLRQHKAKYITENYKICIDSGEVLKILQECIGE